jgi:hypothetical protein
MFIDKLSLMVAVVIYCAGMSYHIFAVFYGKRRLRKAEVLLCWQCSYPRESSDTPCPECGLQCDQKEELAIWRRKYGETAFERL